MSGTTPEKRDGYGGKRSAHIQAALVRLPPDQQWVRQLLADAWDAGWECGWEDCKQPEEP